MGRWIDPSWWTHEASSCSSLCSTTAITILHPLVHTHIQTWNVSMHDLNSFDMLLTNTFTWLPRNPPPPPPHTHTHTRSLSVIYLHYLIHTSLEFTYPFLVPTSTTSLLILHSSPHYSDWYVLRLVCAILSVGWCI